MMHPRQMVLAPFIFASVLATANHGETIDFESITSETLVRDQFAPLRMRIEGDGPSSGLVISKGTHGVPADWLTSGTQLLDVGNAGESTTMRFVDDNEPTWRGASQVIYMIGSAQGNGFEVHYYDVEGRLLASSFHSPPTSPRPRQYDFVDEASPSPPDPPPPLGWMTITNTGGVGRVVLDDLVVELVPEPDAGVLTIGCLFVLCGGVCCRRLARLVQRTRNFTKLVLPVLALIALWCARPAQARTVTLDFESIPSGTQLTDQYLADSVLCTSETASSGFINSKGTNDIPAGFPSSGTQVLLLSDSSTSFFFDFVDPNNPDPFDPAADVPVRRLRFTVGSTADDTYRFDWYFVTENNEFLHLGDVAATGPSLFDSEVVLGPFAGAPLTRLQLYATTSGIVIDDVIVDFVPEPSSIGLAIACFLALFGAASCRRISTVTGNTDGRTTRNKLTLRLFCRS